MRPRVFLFTREVIAEHASTRGGLDRHRRVDRRQGRRGYTAAYSASKHAAIGLMRAAAAEVAGTARDRQRRLPGVRGLRDDRAYPRRASSSHRADACGELEALAQAGAARTVWSTRTRSPTPWSGSPPPRRRRSTARRSCSTEEESRHEPVPRFGAVHRRAGEHFDFKVADGVATDHAQPSRQAQRADLRDLRRPARPVRRAAPPRRRRACWSSPARAAASAPAATSRRSSASCRRWRPPSCSSSPA